MKTERIKILRVAFLLLASSAAVLRVSAVEASDILTPPARQEILDIGKRLFAQREAPAINVDPFHPEAFAEAAAATGRMPGPTVPAGTEAPPVKTGPRSQHELLEAIAGALKPSGNFVINGQQTLLFGQKRVKAGGLLTITFEGAEYTLEVTAIQRTSFTLRLNREEFTRPIK